MSDCNLIIYGFAKTLNWLVPKWNICNSWMSNKSYLEPTNLNIIFKFIWININLYSWLSSLPEQYFYLKLFLTEKAFSHPSVASFFKNMESAETPSLESTRKLLNFLKKCVWVLGSFVKASCWMQPVGHVLPIPFVWSAWQNN